MRLGVATRRYMEARRTELARKTRVSATSALRRFSDAVGPDLLIRNLRRKHVEGWMAGCTCSPASIRTELSVIRNFCRWAVVNGHLKTDPTLGVKGPKQPVQMPRELSDVDVAHLWSCLPDTRAELIVILGLVQGMRRAEIAGQLRENIDLTGRMMLVYGKGDKERWLPIVDDAWVCLNRYLRESPGQTGYLIRNHDHPNRGLTAGRIGELVALWMLEAGVKGQAWDGKSSHALRHTRAGTLLDDGADLREVQAVLGHSSLGPTYVYLRRRHADGALREAMNRRSYL
jgi:site-specific recombinase XerD